jgi:hypothetical protein
VIIDLSPVVRSDGANNWQHVEWIVKSWREQIDPHAVFYGIADNSLMYHLDDHGRQRLKKWKREGRARTVSWADPVILEMAEEYPDATVITTDLFRDHRKGHPWLQGSDRFVKPVFTGSSVAFEKLELPPVPDHEVSWRIEDAELKPKGVTTPEAKAALNSEWACTSDRAVCDWAASPIIEADPAYRDGRVVCPECHEPARRVGAREDTREVVVLLDDAEVDRIPVADGESLTVGRGRGGDRYDVREILDESDQARVSRNHLRLSNRGGRLYVEELGSKNGTMLIQDGSAPWRLPPRVEQALRHEDRISLAKDTLHIRLSGRRRVRRRYAPDLTTAPWVTGQHSDNK